MKGATEEAAAPGSESKGTIKFSFPLQKGKECQAVFVIFC